MTLEQLRIFVAVAECQHVTRAAQSLHLAQSAASHAIAALEASYDTKLFDRIGRRIELTQAGRAFLVEAREVLVRADRAALTLHDFAGLRRGTVTMQASHTIAGYWLPPRLVAFRRSHPQIEVRLALGNSTQVATAVAEGAVELGLVEGRVRNKHLDVAPIARDQLVIVVAPDHPWATRDVVEPAELIEGDWVLREPGSGTRSVLEDALARVGSRSKLRVILELPSNEAVRAAVEAGLGASALSASVIASSVEAKLVRAVRFALPERGFFLLRHRERSLSRAAETLQAALRPLSPPELPQDSICDDD